MSAACGSASAGTGHTVTVLDLYMFGHEVLRSVAAHPRLIQIQGDLRIGGRREGARRMHSVIHLACISNDPSFELNPELGSRSTTMSSVRS